MQPNNGRADKFNPAANIPTEIALKWTDGMPCQSAFSGDQVLFTLTDGRKWYVDPSLAGRIRGLGLCPGEVFSVIKAEVARGNRRSIEWDVRRAAGTDAPVPAAAPVPHTSHYQSTQAPAQDNATPKLDGLSVATLAETGRRAIDAVLAVEEYAHQHGMTDFTFGAENIQKIWLTLFIDVQRKWGR